MGLAVLPQARAAQVLEAAAHLLLQREPGRIAVERQPDVLRGDAGEVREAFEVVRGAFRPAPGPGPGGGQGALDRALAVGEQEAGVHPEEPLHAGRVAEPGQSGARVERTEGGAGGVEVLGYGRERPLPAVLVAAGGAQPQETPVHPLAQRQLGGGAVQHPGQEGRFDPGQLAEPLHGEHVRGVLAAALRQCHDTGPDRAEVGPVGGSHRVLLRQ